VLHGTIPLSINAAGNIAGFYLDTNMAAHGFVRAANGTITTFDAPDAGTGTTQGTFPVAINSAGEITGMYFDTKNVYHGFYLAAANGEITEFDVPGAGTSAHRGTEPLSIDAVGDITGIYTDKSDVRHGFLLTARGTMITFDVSGAGWTGGVQGQGTQPLSINSVGDVTGFYVNASGGFQGFVRASDSTITAPIDVPGAGTSGGSEHHMAFVGTIPSGIDEAGDITGVYTDASGLRHGFVLSAGGTMTYPIDAPGAGTSAGMLQGTIPLSINTEGAITGFYQDANGQFHGFMRTASGAITAPIDAPGAGAAGTSLFPGTVCASLNDSGEIAGIFADASGVFHGFVFNPSALPQAATPTFSPAPGTYSSTQTVTISDATAGATIYYTTNGTTPTSSSTPYTGPITVSSTDTIEAIATASGYSTSAVATATYTITSSTLTPAATPTFSVPSGTYIALQTVTISDATVGATIYYTTDGTIPTTSSVQYTGPILVASTETIEAIATASGYSTSAVATATYTINNTYITLAVFDGTNGWAPDYGPLIQGADGNFYGTTFGEIGTTGSTIFNITPAGTLTTLQTFGVLANPTLTGGLVLGTDGNYYGTTQYDGTNSDGTVFKLTPGGTLTTLYNFGGPDGVNPFAALVEGADGNFYGTTLVGGVGGYGTVFKITPAGALTTLHTFERMDGGFVFGGLVQGTDGNFYGTTSYGGANGVGTVYQITPGGTLTTLHNFDGTDGATAYATLIQATDGNFYGTTSAGGANNKGTVFEITPGGALGTLYNFCAQTNCTDGATPYDALVQAADGNFYGTTSAGGAYGHGSVFQITPAGLRATLHDFEASAGGWAPYGGLLQATSGIFYGTTNSGGDKGGVVFSLDVRFGPFVATNPTSGLIGSSVIILGNNLTGATGVSFNGTAATFTVVSSSEIEATVPGGATTGVVQVTTPSGTLKSNVRFAVTGTLPPAASPTFNPAPGNYSATQSVTLADATPGVVIYYTTDGTTPTTASTQYTGAIQVNSTETIEAIAIASGYSTSAVATATYTITLPQAATPSFSVPSGTYNVAQSVTISDATPGATIYYTTNGTAPTTASTQYTGAIQVTSTETIEAVATASGYLTSPLATVTYTIVPAPIAGVSPTTLTFTALMVNSTSSAQAVKLSNTGSVALSVAGITISGNFAQTNNCGSSVAAGASCTVNVTFTPTAGGALTGTLTITDNNKNTTGSTQTVSLSGTGQDYTLTTPSGSSSSATVSPGQTATYTVAVGAEGGLTQTVNFACTGAPSESTCTVSPSPATPGSNVTVTVTTTAPSVLAPRTFRPPRLPGPQALLVLAMLLACIAWALRGSRQVRAGWRAVFLPLAAIMVLALALAGCGGGKSSTPTNTGTPAGTYTITVTGTSGSGSTAVSHTMSLTLTVS
jgi:uncharacterized repeat protein (TIGR03803 family)